MHYKTARAAEGNRGNRGAVDELSEANRVDHDRGRRARRSQLIKPSQLAHVCYFGVVRLSGFCLQSQIVVILIVSLST